MSDLEKGEQSEVKNELSILTSTNEEVKNEEIEVNLENENNENCFNTMKQKIDVLMADQDFMQKVNVSTTLVLEVYRVLMGAFLLVFVPQNCDGDLCSFNQNINKSDTLSSTGLIINLITMCSFLVLYGIEVKRENKLITYLEVNRFTPVDNESVGEALEKLDPVKKDTILSYDHHYYNSGMVSTGCFLINTIFSCIVIFNNYYDNSTLTVLLTNVLFMGLKVNEVYAIVNTKKNVFYSAYLTDRVQYNDVDPDKLIELKVESDDKISEITLEEAKDLENEEKEKNNEVEA